MRPADLHHPNPINCGIYTCHPPRNRTHPTKTRPTESDPPMNHKTTARSIHYPASPRFLIPASVHSCQCHQIRLPASGKHGKKRKVRYSDGAWFFPAIPSWDGCLRLEGVRADARECGSSFMASNSGELSLGWLVMPRLN